MFRKQGAEGSEAEGSEAGQINTRSKPEEPPDSCPALAGLPAPAVQGVVFSTGWGLG